MALLDVVGRATARGRRIVSVAMTLKVFMMVDVQGICIL